MSITITVTAKREWEFLRDHPGSLSGDWCPSPIPGAQGRGQVIFGSSRAAREAIAELLARQ